MKRILAAIPRAVAFVALFAAMLVGCLWVVEPLVKPPESGLFGREEIQDDGLHLVDPGIVSAGQWRTAETSARLAIIASAMLFVGVVATWRKRVQWRGQTIKLTVVIFLLLVITASAAYPAYLVRRTLELAAGEGTPTNYDTAPSFEKPTPLTPAERDAVGREISPGDRDYCLVVTRAGVLPQLIFNCPVHDKPLAYEKIPHHPRLPGQRVREGFPFGQLVFAERMGIRLPEWPVRRCPDCVNLHERYLGISEEELRFKAKNLDWGFDF